MLRILRRQDVSIRAEICWQPLRFDTTPKARNRTNTICCMAMLLAIMFGARPALAGMPWGAAWLGETVCSQKGPTPRQHAEELLRRARRAMQEGKFDLAEQHLRQVEGMKNIRFDGVLRPFADTPAKVRKDLDRARRGVTGPAASGNANGQLAQPRSMNPAQPNPAPPRLPASATQSAVPLTENGPPSASGPTWIANPFSNGSPPSASNAAQPLVTVTDQPLPPVVNPAAQESKQKALQLLAEAHTALDRGEIAQAQMLVQHAEHLRVPEALFQTGELRPWALRMRIDQEMKRRAGPVVQASGTMVTDDAAGAAGGVVQGLYQPEHDQTRIEPANVVSDAAHPGVDSRDPQAIQTESPAADSGVAGEVTSGGQGMDLFQQGVAAVKRGDLPAARSLFRQAWVYEQELDPETRQRLQEHLQLLKAPVTAQPAFPPADQGPELDEKQRQLVQKTYQEIAQEQSAIQQLRRQQPKAAWERLKELRQRVAATDIPDATRQQLIRRVDFELDETEKFIQANRAAIELDEQNRAVLADVEKRRQSIVEGQERLAKLVEEFNAMMDQQRYSEAIVVAKQAREIEADSELVNAMLWKSRFAERMLIEMSLKERREQGFLDSETSIAESGIPFDDRDPFHFPDVKTWKQLTDRRGKLLREGGRRVTESERHIQEMLKKKIAVSFDNEPLSKVIDTIGKYAGINVFVDSQGLAEQGLTSETPITLKLSNEVSLRSALNLILEPLQLSYVVQDEVLRITSEQMREADMYQQTYPVGDLVVPIPNFVPTYHMGMPAAIREAHQTLQGGNVLGGAIQRAPLTYLGDNGGNVASTSPAVLAQMESTGMLPSRGPGGPQSVHGGPGGLGGGAAADFDSLIELITTTIEPASWLEGGGEGSVESYETNLSLVVRQTEEVHEQIADLLAQLRRYQDLQVTIEVRFITLTDNFLERIGVDFDFNIDDNVTTLPPEDNGPSVTIGLNPTTGQPTADLDLQFTQGSFGAAVPQFGGFDPASAANFGFAILSDIEAFFIIQAAAADVRSNVLQAPKVTLFNGQFAQLADQAQRPFVTSIIPVVGDFAVGLQPVITVLSEGTALNVQAVVSNDRRFVRLTLVPFFSRIQDVDEFTFDGSRSSNSGTTVVDPTDPDSTVTNGEEEITQGTTVQLPTLAFTTVSTTVSVPDGGTILLGGIKRLREGRDEHGVPVLSKVPYLNRLFRNVAIARQAQSLMMMVTPRIIIQEEQEEDFLGPQAIP